MPTVQEIYEDLVKQGKTKKDAAREAQQRTGVSLVTGRPINKDLPLKVKYAGQYR